MIAATYARLLFAGLGPLACATSASAECARMLWQSSVIAGEETWSVVSAYSPSGGDEDACKQAAARFKEEGNKRATRPGDSTCILASPTPWTCVDRRGSRNLG